MRNDIYPSVGRSVPGPGVKLNAASTSWFLCLGRRRLTRLHNPSNRLSHRYFHPRLGADAGENAVARNREVVPRASWSSTPLRRDDRIEIVTAAAGG